MIEEIKKDIFKIDLGENECLAHCISSDCALGAGIAIEFEKRFKLRNKLLLHSPFDRKHPTCIFENNVFNLITKEKYWHKPTYESLKLALLKMKEIAIQKKIKFIAMPRIGSGLDGLSWNNIRQIIDDMFDDGSSFILICHL